MIKDSDFEESIGAKMKREKNVIRLSNSFQWRRCQIDGKIQMSFLRLTLSYCEAQWLHFPNLK